MISLSLTAFGEIGAMKMHIAALLGFLVSGFPAQAEGLDGNFLFSSCNDPAESFTQGWCVGLISGTAAMIDLENMEQGATHYWKSCRPKGSTNGQLLDVVKKYLTEFPEKRHLNGTMLILIAFGRAFPCPN